MTELMKSCRNVFYFSVINAIGGVESFFWYLAQKYPNLEVYYKSGDLKQISRLAELISTHKYTGGTIVCDKFFCQYNVDVLDNVEANDIYYIVHSDYKTNGFMPIVHPKINHYIGVSQLVCDNFKDLTGLDCELIYNPLVINKKAKKPLIIVSAMRLSREKGLDNMLKLAEKLDKENIRYLWFVFTNNKKEFNNSNIILVEPKLDIAPYLKIADYVAALSTSEAYGYTPIEALSLGVPVLLMDLPIWKELGIKDKEHGYIIDNIESFDVNKLLNIPKNITYEAPKDNWGKYLKGKTSYDPNKLIKVKPIKDYFDVEFNKWVHIKDEPFEVKISRAIYLMGLGLVKEIK